LQLEFNKTTTTNIGLDIHKRKMKTGLRQELFSSLGISGTPVMQLSSRLRPDAQRFGFFAFNVHQVFFETSESHLKQARHFFYELVGVSIRLFLFASCKYKKTNKPTLKAWLLFPRFKKKSSLKKTELSYNTVGI